MRPSLVSFVVPCYKLAHLLRDCVESILRQTYPYFEVLIMDDCSPDSTPEVAAQFDDPRVRYVRNDRNLGHLRNYNHGITLASGDYLWLISADDCLRGEQALSRAVAVLDSDSGMTFAFAPGITIDPEGVEGACMGTCGSTNRILDSDAAVQLCLKGNPVCTPSAVARRQAYLREGMFPLDLPYAGDWYMWSVFAMEGTVGYIAEPLSNYRIHSLSNTAQYTRSNYSVIVKDEIAVRWRLKKRLQAASRATLAAAALESIIGDYTDRLKVRATRGGNLGMSSAEFEQSLNEHCEDAKERALIMSRSYEWAADFLVEKQQPEKALAFYQAAAAVASDMRVTAKIALTRLGSGGTVIRSMVSGIQKRVRVH